jgi:hypothetical protein
MKRESGNSAENPKHEIQNSKQTSIAKKKLRSFGVTRLCLLPIMLLFSQLVIEFGPTDLTPLYEYSPDCSDRC